MAEDQGKQDEGGNPGGANPPEFALLDGRIRHVLTEMGITPQQPAGNGGSGTGGGGGSTLEPRIAQLEVHTEYIKRDVSELRIDAKETRENIHSINTKLTTLAQTVGRLPRKGFIITAVTGVLALFAAVVTFQEQIHALFHLH
jgi:hypothetical protein